MAGMISNVLNAGLLLTTREKYTGCSVALVDDVRAAINSANSWSSMQERAIVIISNIYRSQVRET